MKIILHYRKQKELNELTLLTEFAGAAAVAFGDQLGWAARACPTGCQTSREKRSSFGEVLDYVTAYRIALLHVSSLSPVVTQSGLRAAG
jgi:hypothetical protein